MAAGSVAEVPGGHPERALYVASGAVEMDGRQFEAGKMLVLGAAASQVRAIETSTVMVLGGEPVGERFIYWNFASSSKDRLEQAAADWKAGRMKLPDADEAEFIPLLDPPPIAAPALS
jgi:redox-sensitive bicupin YhaK (pirin superfamily)